jgi:hypothetical protein
VVGVAAGGRAARWVAVLHGAALVRTIDAVLNERLSVAAHPATSKIGVEALQALGRVPCKQEERDVAEDGADVVPDDPLIVHAGCRV